MLITGANYAAGTAGQAIISATGGFNVSGTSDSAQYVTLQNLTFTSTGSSPALAFSGAGYGDVVDSCRISSNVGGMTVANSPGYQDPYAGGRPHSILIPGVTLENSVVAAGAGCTGVSYVNSPTLLLRNDTIVGGATGVSFTSVSYDASMLDDILSGQTAACVYFSSDSLADGPLPGYEGDGNIYNPAGGGDVATVQTSSGANCYTTLDSYAEFWFVQQYGSSSGAGMGTRSDGRSLQAAPAFVSSSGGDFRLAPTVGNLLGTGEPDLPPPGRWRFPHCLGRPGRRRGCRATRSTRGPTRRFRRSARRSP